MIQPDMFVGQMVEITFWDHVSGSDVTDVWLCKVWGKLLDANWRRVLVQVWETEESETDNAECVAIVQSTIEGIRPLEYKE